MADEEMLQTLISRALEAERETQRAAMEAAMEAQRAEMEAAMEAQRAEMEAAMEAQMEAEREEMREEMKKALEERDVQTEAQRAEIEEMKKALEALQENNDRLTQENQRFKKVRPDTAGLDVRIQTHEFLFLSSPNEGKELRAIRQGSDLRPVLCPFAWKFATNFDSAARGALISDELHVMIREEVGRFTSLLNSQTRFTNSIKGVELTWSGGTAAVLNKIFGLSGISRDVYAIDQLACTKPSADSSSQETSQQDNRKAIKLDIGVVLKNRLENNEEREEVPIVIEFKPLGRFDAGLDQLARYCSAFAHIGIPPTFLVILLDLEKGQMQAKLMMPGRFPAQAQQALGPSASGITTTERSAASSSSNETPPVLRATSTAPSTVGRRKGRSATAGVSGSSAASSSAASTLAVSSNPVVRFLPMDLITVTGESKEHLLTYLIFAICRTVQEMKQGASDLFQSRQQEQLWSNHHCRSDGSYPSVARHGDLVVKVYHPSMKENYRSIDLNVTFMNATVELNTALVQVLTYPWIEGDVSPEILNVRQFIGAATKLASLYSTGLEAHGDLRFSNLVFTNNDNAEWIDFDYSVASGKERRYPPFWNRNLRDTERHPEAIAGSPILREHDLFSFAHMLALYKPSFTHYHRLWSLVCKRAEGCSTIEDIVVELESFHHNRQDCVLEQLFEPYQSRVGTGSRRAEPLKVPGENLPLVN